MARHLTWDTQNSLGERQKWILKWGKYKNIQPFNSGILKGDLMKGSNGTQSSALTSIHKNLHLQTNCSECPGWQGLKTRSHRREVYMLIQDIWAAGGHHREQAKAAASPVQIKGMTWRKTKPNQNKAGTSFPEQFKGIVLRSAGTSPAGTESGTRRLQGRSEGAGGANLPEAARTRMLRYRRANAWAAELKRRQGHGDESRHRAGAPRTLVLKGEAADSTPDRGA